MFIIRKHPLSIGLILLLQTVFIRLSSRLIAKNFWFSYILFLIFLGGILILFIYVISLASNEIFNFSLNITFKNLLVIIIFCLILIFIDQFLLNNINQNLETLINKNENYMILENIQILNKIFNFPRNIITILLIIYLFLCLIAICKIIYIFEGPLRPKF